jgi:TP901 family phage tail tape measure protein
MKGAVTKPDFKITIGADSGQIEANVVKAINEAVASINKDTDTKLKKLKVQIDKEALKNQIQNSVSSVHIKQFDGLGKQIGNDIASAIKKSLANVQIGKISGNVSGTSTSGTAKPSNGLPSDRNKLINTWAKQYSEQEMKLYTAVADILNRSSKMATADYEKLLDQFQAYEDNLKQFSSNLTKRERSVFDSAVKTEQSKSKYDTFHMAKQTYDNMWGVGGGSLTDVLRSVGGSVHPDVSKVSYDLSKKLSSMLEYVPFDASNIDAGLDGITDKINEAVKAQVSGMQVLARNVKVESDSMSDSNKKIDEHIDVMKLAAEAEAKKAEQSKATGDAIAKETENITKNNAAAKAHADTLSGNDANPDYIKTLNDVTVAQGIRMNSDDIDKIAKLAAKQKKAGYELQAVSVDKVFDADGITNITGSLRYFNKEFQTTVSQGYTAKKALDAEEEGVYELQLAHERLIQTFKNEKTVNEALLKAQADAVKNQLYAQIDSSHQPRDAVITGSLKGYFDDSFIVNTKDKLDELKRAISAAKSNLSALEQVAKSGDSFNALTNQYEKFEKTPATLEKLTVAIGKLKNSNVSILGNDIDLTDNLKRLKETYDLIEKAKSQPISNLPVDKQVDAVKNRVQAIRDYLTEIRLLSGYVGAAKAVELNDSRKEKYDVDYDKMQSNFQKAEQNFDKLTVKSPELKKRLEEVRAVVSSISDQFDGSAANASSVASALKQIQALNSRIVAERNSPVNSVANIQDNLLSWKTQLAGYQLDTNKLSDKAYASDSIAAVSELSAEYTRLKQLADEYLALASAGTEEEKRKAEELRIASERYETLNKSANALVGLTKKNAAAELSQAVNSRNLQNLEATFRNFMSANGKVNENAGLRVMASNIDAQIETLKKAGDKLDESSIAKLRQNLSLLDSLSSELGYKGQTYEQRIQGKMQELTSYFVSVTSFGFAIQQIRNMISNVNALDDAMTELRKVTEETDATYDKFLTNAAKRVQTLGSTMSDVVIATGSFARMGYNLEEAEKLGDAAIIAQNVWDNVGSIDETAGTIISAMKAFGIEAENAISIVDRLNAVSNSFGVVSGDIANAMADAGAALYAAGNSYDESIGLFSATNEVIQDWSKTATALRTIAARIRNTSGELAEMEIDADGAAESITQLQQKIYKASGNKVNIFEDDNETFKSTIQILRELSEVWNTLSDVDQAEITRLIAGTRQQSVFAAIMNNFDTVDKVIETSVNSTGSAVAENEKYLDSITGKLDLLKSSYEALSSSIINSDNYKGGIDLLRGVLDLLNQIASVFSGGALIGTLNSVAGAAGYGLFDLETILEAKSNGSKNWFRDGSLWGMLVGNDKADSKIMEQIADEFKAAQGSAESYGDVLQSVSSRFAALHSETRKTLEANLATKSSFSDAEEFARQYATQLGEATVKTKLLTLAGKAGNIALNAFTGFLVGAAIDGLISLGKYIFTMRQRSIDAAAEITKAWKEAEDKLEDMKSSVKSLTDSYDEFEKLSKGVSAYGENLSLTADEYDRYHEISNQIADLFPSLIVGYDSQYNAVVKLKNGVADLNAEYEKAARAQRNQVITEAGDALKGLRDKWFGGGVWSSTVSQYDIYQILKDSLDIGLDATKNKYAEMVYDPGANQYLPNYSNISAALKDARLDFYNLIDGWQDVVSARIQTLSAEFDTDFLENYSKQVSAYLYNNDIFAGLDEKTQSEIIALLNNVDKTFVGELAKNNESIFPWLQKAIIKPLSDSSTKKDISDAINDLMSLSDADTLDGIRKEIDRIGKILPEDLTSALGSYLKSGDLDIDEWTQDLTVKFGSRLGKAISESFSLADIKVALSDAFDWDTLAPDNTLEKFNAELDRCKTKIEAVAASTKSVKITEAIDSFNKAVQAANRLFAAQELSDGKLISDDVYDRLKDQNTELVATLERVDDELTGQHGWKIVDSDIEKYIEKQQSAAEETLRSNGAISEQYALLQKYLGGANNVEERISAYAEANSKLGDAYDKVASKEQFAYSEMISLRDTFPDLRFELDQATGKYNLIGDSVVSLMKKNYEFIKSLQQQRLELLRFNAINIFQSSRNWDEKQATQNIDNYIHSINENGIRSLQEYNEFFNHAVTKEDVSDFITDYTAALTEIEQAQADIDALIAKAPAGELKNKSKSSSKSDTEFSKNLKQLNMEKEALESEMELDPAFVKYNLSSMEDYYSKLANIAKAGYAAGEIDAVEYQGYVLDVFNGLREEVKKGYQKSFDTLSTEKKKFDEGMDWDKSLFATLRDYYTNLGELAKKAYNNGAIDADEYQDYLIEVFKGLKEASVKEYDDMLSKLEDERQKYDAGMVWDRSVFTDLSDYYDKIEEINEKRFKENLSTTSEYVDELVKIFEGRNEMLEKTLSDYEHDITLMQNRDSVNSTGIPESEIKQIETYRMMQEMVHKAADTYREQMTGTMSDTEIEHSEYIKDMQTKWWEYENNIQSIQSEMFERSLSAYEDYISRRNKFGNWGADNEIAAWKRVDKFLDQSYENGIINYKTYLEKKLDVLESMYDAEKQRQQDFADAAVRIMEKELDALNKQKENYEKQKGNYESTVSAVVDLINDQIDKLKTESDELDKQLKLQKALKAVEEARNQRNIHIYRDNGTGFDWEADDKAVRQAQESYDELKREQDLNDQIDALEKYRDAWQATIDDYEKNIDKQKAMALLGADWEKQILDMRTDKIEGFAQNYSDICDQLNEDVTGSIASQIKDLEDLKDEWSDAVDNIEYELGRYDELMDFEDEFRGAGLEQRKAMLEDFSQSGVQNLQNLIDKANELQNALDSLNGINTSDYGDSYPTLADDTAQKEQNVINEMKQNSAAWWFANESEQKTLSDRNKVLGESLGWTRDADGIWWKKNGVRAYAEGGIADYTGVAMLHGTKSKPELVLNNADAGYLYSVLHGRQLVNPTSPSVQKAGETTVTIGDINLSGVNSPDTLAEAIVRQLPSRLIQRMSRK